MTPIILYVGNDSILLYLDHAGFLVATVLGLNHSASCESPFLQESLLAQCFGNLNIAPNAHMDIPHSIWIHTSEC